jgi:myo-inositol 2-dehydrogenase / D-chiro-inositol 1-dehydrogenase
MNKLKFGVIGAGDASNYHTIGAKNREEALFEYVAVCDINEKAAKRVARRNKSMAYTDLDEFLKSDLDVVLIAVPHYLHAEMAKKVAEAGKHVLCEKPMAPTLEECDEMISVTKKAGVKFMIAENHRFLPAHQKIKNLLEQGYIGDVYLGRTYEGAFCTSDQFMNKDKWNFTYDRGGGGVLADQGVHKFALLNWLLGDVKYGQAWLGKMHNSPPIKAEDNAIMLLQFQSGAMIEVMVSSTTVHPLNNNLELHGKEGHILEDHSWLDPIRIFTSHPDAEKKGEYYDISIEHGPYPKYYSISMFHEDNYFADCIIHDKDPEFTPEHAKEAVAVVLLGYLSAKKGTRVSMEELKEYAKERGTKSLLEGLPSVTTSLRTS